jgi:hypothetical protein
VTPLERRSRGRTSGVEAALEVVVARLSAAISGTFTCTFTREDRRLTCGGRGVCSLAWSDIWRCDFPTIDFGYCARPWLSLSSPHVAATRHRAVRMVPPRVPLIP